HQRRRRALSLSQHPAHGGALDRLSDGRHEIKFRRHRDAGPPYRERANLSPLRKRRQWLRQPVHCQGSLRVGTGYDDRPDRGALAVGSETNTRRSGGGSLVQTRRGQNRARTSVLGGETMIRRINAYSVFILILLAVYSFLGSTTTADSDYQQGVKALSS